MEMEETVKVSYTVFFCEYGNVVKTGETDTVLSVSAALGHRLRGFSERRRKTASMNTRTTASIFFLKSISRTVDWYKPES